jgi:hypothetical protein
MSERNLKALNKVLKTLSAVRTTLNDEERIILDQLILQSEPDDVTSHSLSSKAASKNLLLDEDDVSAHGMVSKSSSKQLLRSQLLLDDNGAYQIAV